METEKVLQTPTPAAQEKASEMPFLGPDCPRDPDYDADFGTDVITRLLEGTWELEAKLGKGTQKKNDL